MVTLKQFTASSEFNVISIVAGEKGLDRPITGVNVTESSDLAEFYRPNELIITTGINMENNPEKLVDMVEIAFHRKAAGIVLNTGPYIPSIPKQILTFADAHHFPVFQMPWDYRVADFLKITVQFLATAQNAQTRTEKILTNLLFNPDPPYENISNELSHLGYKSDATFSIIVCAVSHSDVSITTFIDQIEHTFNKRYKQLLSVVYENQLIYMVEHSEIQTPEIPFSKTVESIYTKSKKKRDKAKLHIGKGNFYKSIADISKSYHEAVTVIHLTQRHDNPFLCRYKEIGAYKILMGVHDRQILEAFHQGILGHLYRYDKLNGTDFVHFLRIFLEEDGHSANIGRRVFIHRNTVLYKIKKIESILDINLNSSFTKTNISLAFMIEDVI
ncbi:PucR family transcriptional regulator [Niallia sp. 01092]|uniref:PucR family transcriptional regulator n=1 Tax=unclassified Niallia TaxID=2837522 RepID=UPI003FD281A4